jgi:hypothetical protein
MEPRIEHKKKLIAEQIKQFDYRVFGEWSMTVKTYAAILRRAILLSSDEQFELFLEKLKEYEQTIYDIIDGKEVRLDFDEKEKQYFDQAVVFLEQINPERKEVLKRFIKRILDVLRDETKTDNN